MTGSLLADQFSPPQGAQALPPAREFVTSAGFAGALAFLAVLIVAGVAVVTVRGFVRRHQLLVEQQERHQRELRAEERRAAGLKECRERLAWVVDKGGIEPAASEGATVGFGPELALTILQGIQHDAEKLDDTALAKAAAVQLQQLSLVLAKQGGDMAQLAAVESAPADPVAADKAKSNGDLSASPTPGSDILSPSSARSVPASGRRRRQ